MTNKRVDNKNCAVFLGECCNKDDTGCGNCMESSQMTNNQFKRKDRYLVLKITDLYAALKRGLMSPDDIEVLKKVATAVEESRLLEGKAEFGCAVVEHDWPEYEPVWAMIEARVTGAKQ